MSKRSQRSVAALLACAIATAVTTPALADGSEVVAAVAPQTPVEPPPAEAVATATTTTAATVPLKTAAAVAGGAAVAALGAGIAFGVLALNDKSRFESVVNGSTHLSSVDTAQAGTSASENAVLADMCFGGAVVAAVTSILLFVRSSRETTQEPASAAAPGESKGVSFMLAPSITPHGAGAGAALVF